MSTVVAGASPTSTGAGPDESSAGGRDRSGAVGPTGGHRGDTWRRWWARAVWIVIAGLIVVTVAWLTASSASPQGLLDPDSSLDDGSLAVRSVLADHGIEVQVTRSQADFLRASVAADTTVLVTATENLSDTTAQIVRRHTAGAARLVLIGPDSRVLTGLGLPLQPSYDATYSAVAAGCADPDAARAGEISGGDIAYTPQASALGAVSCFPAPHGGYLVDLGPRPGRPAVTVLGAPDVLANHHVTDSGNAALALGLLGDTPRLVWYVPDVDDTPVGDQSTLASALPRWLTPAQLLGWSALLALMLWRGRRFGRLVPEPLPVVIKAIETTQSRGRMYRKAGDRGRALAVLQAGARARLARYLGLPAGAAPAAIVAAVGAATGRPVHEVDSVLVSATAPDDPTLLAMAGHLASLEKDVRRR